MNLATTRGHCWASLLRINTYAAATFNSTLIWEEHTKHTQEQELQKVYTFY